MREKSIVFFLSFVCVQVFFPVAAHAQFGSLFDAVKKEVKKEIIKELTKKPDPEKPDPKKDGEEKQTPQNPTVNVPVSQPQVSTPVTSDPYVDYENYKATFFSNVYLDQSYVDFDLKEHQRDVKEMCESIHTGPTLDCTCIVEKVVPYEMGINWEADKVQILSGGELTTAEHNRSDAKELSEKYWCEYFVEKSKSTPLPFSNGKQNQFGQAELDACKIRIQDLSHVKRRVLKPQKVSFEGFGSDVFSREGVRACYDVPRSLEIQENSSRTSSLVSAGPGYHQCYANEYMKVLISPPGFAEYSGHAVRFARKQAINICLSLHPD